MKHSQCAASLHLLLLGAFALGTPAITLAQSTSAQAPQPSGSDTLAEVVVTATKRTENTIDVPIAITVQSGDALAAAQIQNMFDLTQVVPGLNYTSGASARPNLRGVTSLSSAAGAENNIAIYVDGIYQPNLYGNTFDLPDIADVQVLKGPQGTLFGRNAEGGAIVISTRNPTFTTTGDIEVSEGTYDGGYNGGTDTTVTGFLSGPVSDKLALSISGLYNTTPGYAHDALRGGRTGLINAELFRAKALFKPADNAEILVIAYYGERTDNSVYNLQNLNPLKAVPALAPSQPFYVANDAAGLFQVERYGTSVKGTFTFDVGTFTSLSGLTVLKPQIVADDDASSAQLQVYLLGQPNTTVSQEFDFASRKFGDFSFVSGLFIYNSVEKFTPLQVAASLTGPVFYTDYAKSTDDAWALFSEGNYAITDRLN
jgi:iron complex outermembrane recepter protein